MQRYAMLIEVLAEKDRTKKDTGFLKIQRKPANHPKPSLSPNSRCKKE